MKKTNKGFTIVELVIVIAVIGVLAAVLIPTFSNVVEKAQESAQTQTVSNGLKNYLANAADEGNLSSMDGLVFVYDKDQKDTTITDRTYYLYMSGQLNKIAAANVYTAYAAGIVKVDYTDAEKTDITFSESAKNEHVLVYTVKVNETVYQGIILDKGQMGYGPAGTSTKDYVVVCSGFATPGTASVTYKLTDGAAVIGANLVTETAVAKNKGLVITNTK